SYHTPTYTVLKSHRKYVKKKPIELGEASCIYSDALQNSGAYAHVLPPLGQLDPTETPHRAPADRSPHHISKGQTGCKTGATKRLVSVNASEIRCAVDFNRFTAQTVHL
ncbi:hypothetical protein, partial [Collinsella sp. An2]|uniref:hypothetical protein n=1 Tax=Collinsella sp. An2 TaxID=1965585 RepID=UPI001951B2F6